MKTYLKYIFLVLILGLTAISCQKELEPSSRPLFDGEALTLVPRVKSFANQYVTKADDKTAYTDNEKKITRLAILVFDNNGNLIHIQEGGNDGGISSLSVNKSVLNTTTRAEVLDEATVVMFANISLDAIKTVKDGVTSTIRDIEKLEELGNYSYHFANSTTETDVVVTDLENNFKGFPMVGTATVDLRPTTTQQDAVSVNLKILYAKIIFNISVADGSENQSLIQNGPSFSLSGYSINNVAKVASYNEPAEGAATANNDYAYIKSSNPETTVTVSKTGTATKNSNPLEFTFYVAESRYNPKSDADGKIDLSGIYPENNTVGKEYTWLTNNPNEDVEGYNAETDADKLNGVKYFYDNLIQQYKPNLVNSEGTPKTDETGLATYVTVNGTYTDYRGTVWTVNYKIFLGKDNAHNFHVDRNSEYTNYLTIKGIRNNDSYGNGDVWIDHRVNVSTTDPSKHITITRETLIDSHIEVRPLRVKWDEGNYTFARVHLPYYQDNGWVQRDEATSTKKNWIGIERGNKTSSLYCKDVVSKGKRKYFTSALIQNLNTISGDTDVETDDGTNFILLENNECAWIYIDEYIYNEGSTTFATNDRTAKIVVDFCTVSGNSFTVQQVEEYILFQKPLLSVNNGDFYLENYEEYLYSYDSYEKYNINTSPTDYTGQGIQWGYSKSKVSKSQFVTNSNAVTGSLSGFWEGITNPDNGNPYDFFHTKDKETSSGFTVQYSNESEVDLTGNTGFNFTYTASEQNGITISSMGEMPTNAYQYCLSKNKFSEALEGDSHKMIIHWYVPDAYELADIFGFQDSPLSKNCYYWSSQPSYRTSSEKTYIYEDVANARAVSSNRNIESKSRSDRHRVRCVYDINGLEANMTDRTPEGIGGLIKIPMTVANDGFFFHDGWLQELQQDETTKDYDIDPYKFPKNDEFDDEADETAADKDFSGATINGVHYYAKNPLKDDNWGKLNLSWLGWGVYYSMIHNSKWPGLTNMKVENVASEDWEKIAEYVANADALCELTNTPKTDTKIITSRRGRKIDNLPTNADLAEVNLDHNEDTENTMNISFDIGKNKINSPTYKYHKEDPSAAVVKTYTKYWNVPEYSSTNISGGEVPYSCPEDTPNYDETEIKNDIKGKEYTEGSGLNTKIKRRIVVDGTLAFINAKTIYLYGSRSAAEDAAIKYFNNVINKNNEFKPVETSWGSVTHPVISTPSQEILIGTYNWTGETYSWGRWKANGDSGTGMQYKATRYTWTMTCQKKDGTYYKYVSGTGGWGDETGPEETTGAEAALESVDALTFYAGNTFTIKTNITTDSEGKQYKHYIRSVKVNYNTSTITEGEVYLRFVSGATYLPSNNVEPKQMTYLDGDNGWSKWTSDGNDETVTLRLVIYDKSDAGLTNFWNPPFSHTDPAYKGILQNQDTEFKYQLIINSLEIRLEDVPIQTN